jgi:hypothetical protein
MHVGPEAFCCDDVMLCSPAEAQQWYVGVYVVK